MNLETLLRLEESKTLEFKENAHSKERLIASVVAMANTAGGRILIGVEDKTKYIRGVPQPYVAEERLASLISDTIAPALLPTIEILPWRDTHLILLDVPLSPSRPHYITQKGLEVSTYVRVGSTNRLADRDLIESIRRSVHVRSYDEEPFQGAALKDLDMQALETAFQPFRVLEKRDLFSLGILTKSQEVEVLTIGGYLFFGLGKDKAFPDAWIQAGCFQGVQKAVILDSQNIHSHFHEAVPHALNFIRRHLRVGLRIENVTHEEEWEIPRVALREALLNALVHTDYSLQGAPIRVAIFDDRVEIENPGLLPFGLTLEDIRLGFSKLRNRVIARIFRELKQTEQWGSGVRRILDACTQAGLASPLFEEVSSHRFRVTLYRRRTKPVFLDSIDQHILTILSQEGALSTKEIAHHIRMTERSARPRLKRLLELGKIQAIGRSHQDPRKKYVLSQRHEPR